MSWGKSSSTFQTRFHGMVDFRGIHQDTVTLASRHQVLCNRRVMEPVVKRNPAALQYAGWLCWNWWTFTRGEWSYISYILKKGDMGDELWILITSWKKKLTIGESSSFGGWYGLDFWHRNISSFCGWSSILFTKAWRSPIQDLGKL